MPRVETVEWNGVVWRRYPDAKQRSRRVYFWGYLGKSHGLPRKRRESLHRAVWEHTHGAIPDGYEVHHKDGNPLNNAPDNLECITVAAHRRIEGDRGSYSTPKALAHLGRVRGKAAAWHSSPEGRAWHSANAVRAMAERKLVSRLCKQCGKQFRAKHGYAMYCSSPCYDLGRPDRPAIHNLVCEFCGGRFNSPRPGQRFCSYACSGRARWAARRARVQPPG
jgi:hypothetical protein